MDLKPSSTNWFSTCRAMSSPDLPFSRSSLTQPGMSPKTMLSPVITWTPQNMGVTTSSPYLWT